MASVLPIGDRWRAQVRRAGHPSIAKTFDTKREAEAWARQVETGLDNDRPALLADDLRVNELLRQFRRMRMELGRPVNPASNTEYMLQHLEQDLGDERVRDLSPERLARWGRLRKEQGAGGYTVNMELSQLGTAIRHTAAYLRVTLPDVVGLARPLLHYGQLISGGNKRTRRPSEDELSRLLAWLQERNPVTRDAVEVAAITGMRRSEIARIQWADVDDKQRAVLVRQRKHPRRIEARDEWVPLLGDAWTIVQRQQGRAGRIFPVSVETLTDSVTAATRALSIPDLRLHDMRRQATSALREMGFDRDARKAVTGHRSDEVHEGYVVVSMEELHSRFDAAQGKPPRPPHRRKADDRPS